jgi:hypothetical protein
MSIRNVLRMFTIYESPLDYPGKFVVRGGTVASSGDYLHDTAVRAVVDSIDAARAWVPDGLYCLPRDPNDDPCIVEVWL